MNTAVDKEQAPIITGVGFQACANPLTLFIIIINIIVIVIILMMRMMMKIII